LSKSALKATYCSSGPDREILKKIIYNMTGPYLAAPRLTQVFALYVTNWFRIRL